MKKYLIILLVFLTTATFAQKRITFIEVANKTVDFLYTMPAGSYVIETDSLQTYRLTSKFTGIDDMNDVFSSGNYETLKGEGANTCANKALSNLANVAINTHLIPITYNSIRLGSYTKGFEGLSVYTGGDINWTDGGVVGVNVSLTGIDGLLSLTGANFDLTSGELLFNSGGIINFNSGDVTLTHSADLLSLSGGDFSVIGDMSGVNLDLSGTATIGTIANSPTNLGSWLQEDGGTIMYRTTAEVKTDLGLAYNLWEYELTIDDENDLTVPNNLLNTTLVFYNGINLASDKWSGVGTTTLTLLINRKKYDYIKIKY